MYKLLSISLSMPCGSDSPFSKIVDILLSELHEAKLIVLENILGKIFAISVSLVTDQIKSISLLSDQFVINSKSS